MSFTIIFMSIALLCSASVSCFASSSNMRPSMSDAGNGSVVYQEWKDETRGRIVPVKIYLPTNARGPCPIVIFSHGLGGSREAAVYLGEHWMKNGYVGVFVQHIGSDASVWQPVRQQGREKIIDALNAAINSRTFYDRVEDIKFVLDELERLNKSSGPLYNRLDLSRIAMSGHSYGAGTTLTMVGQKYFLGRREVSFADPRIKAAIYLSPPAKLRGRTPEEVFGDIQVPGLLMTGTDDNSQIGGTPAEDRRLPFDGMKFGDQYLLTFIGGDHMIFNGATRRAAKPGDKQMIAEIERVTTAFLNAYLRGEESERRWLNSEAAKFVASDAKFERK
ncbi:MAG TPA: hypothetical protein V6D17_08130 [Candidatus Obscuribacterales bacterium]